MKITTLIIMAFFSGFTLFGQNASFISNCNTDFWTITSDGYIQQWSLSNRNISGGDTLLSGGGVSLGYCGNSNSPTFFSNRYSPIGITYYDQSMGWVDIPTQMAVDNNGGHLNDQYYKVEGAVIQIIKYWDGINLLTVDSLNGEFFAGTHDIGVDTLGHAWVFTGSLPSSVDSLKVYNQNGLINSHAIQFSQTAYGSFFLNDTLYIGTVQDSIYPIIINGSLAHLGNPIYFPSNGFTDMASCQRAELNISISTYANSKIRLFPNPTSGYLTLTGDIEKSSISVYNFQGQLIELKMNGKTIDLSEQPQGVYFVQLNSKGWPCFYKVMKLN